MIKTRRFVTIKNPNNIIQYNNLLLELIKGQNLHKKIKKLKEDFKINPTSVHLSEQFNNIDKRICSLQRKAEKRVGTSPFLLPWSPEISLMKFKLEFMKKILKTTPFLISVHHFNKCSQY